ncbi:DUF4177 domain-containing protein [Leptolyngbya sp. PCC 6406]|uniref:DUF4177 domain-containing protein n=1 Tax=Leptolyngbya sp. PCC 6406 TaxID=1173264 RepID=UPI0002AB9B2C|nr:DUF4177 domain-containing protein [Leptolyngbya sp. PCC 6406]
MATEYKVISDWLCLTTKQKARRIERHLNRLSAEGWEFVALNAVMFFGNDVGFYLILKRSLSENPTIQYDNPI